MTLRPAALSTISCAFALVAATQASAQNAACPSPAYEKRVFAAALQFDKPMKGKFSKAQEEAYARCQLRRVCNSGLDKTEFEMYALDMLISYGNDKAETESTARWKRDGKKQASAMEKIKSPNAIREACLREIGG